MTSGGVGGLAAVARPACVADARLVLARLGVLSVARLTTEFDLWMPREVREIVHDAGRHVDAAARLVPLVDAAPLRGLDAARQAEEIRMELAQWNRLPDDPELASLPLYHLGERADECQLPAHTDRNARDRFEQLQRGLDVAVRAARYDLPRGEQVSACFRDAAALCAALQPYRAFILTRLEDDADGAPALCDYLEAWGVPVGEAPPGAGRALRPIRDALVRVGLEPMGWAGVCFAVVHVIVPGYPIFGDAARALDDAAVRRLWCQASVFWHLV